MDYLGLNPRFDGAFLNWIDCSIMGTVVRLNPRFDGAFLNCKWPLSRRRFGSLNPRFDGAFLNFNMIKGFADTVES